MLELPFNRSGRRKNANLEVTLVLVLTSSIEGRLGDEGMRFRTLCTKPIDTEAFVVRWEMSRDRRAQAGPKSPMGYVDSRGYYNMYSESQD